MLALVAGAPGGLGNVDATGKSARFTQPWYLADDGHGGLFVTDGDAVRRLDEQSGAVTTLAGVAYSVNEAGGFVDGPGAVARFDAPAGLAADSAGLLYVADAGNRAIRTIETATGETTTIVTASDVSEGDAGVVDFVPVGLALDGIGNLYVATFGAIPSAGSQHETGGAIYRVALVAHAVTLVAGSPGATPGLVDGTGTAASFGHPRGLVYDGQGGVYVNDGSAIRYVDVSSGAVVTLAAQAGIQDLYGLAYDGAGTLYAADGASVIRVVSTSTGSASTIAGQVDNAGASDGSGAAATFDAPTGVALGTDGMLRIADTGNYTLRAMVTASGSVTTVAGAPASDQTVDGTGANARFDSPQGVAWDGAEHLFVVDWSDNTVRAVDLSTGAVKTLAGRAGYSGNADGTGSKATFYEPTWVTYDGSGHVFVADSGNFAVRRIDVGTGAVTTVGGGDFIPGGVAFGGGQLYVADSAFSTIRQMNPTTGATTIIAGTPGRGCGSVDGVGAAASFCGPQGLAYDGAGSLYVTDNQTVRRLELTTSRVTTIAGSPGVQGSADGVGEAARFDEPTALACDVAGHVYVADGFNATVRQIVVATREVRTAVGRAGQYGVILGPLATARLNGPEGLTMGPEGALCITDIDENVLLVDH
jgi:sugar lactone lactonase YvrE